MLLEKKACARKNIMYHYYSYFYQSTYQIMELAKSVKDTDDFLDFPNEDGTAACFLDRAFLSASTLLFHLLYHELCLLLYLTKTTWFTTDKIACHLNILNLYYPHILKNNTILKQNSSIYLSSLSHMLHCCNVAPSVVPLRLSSMHEQPPIYTMCDTF